MDDKEAKEILQAETEEEPSSSGGTATAVVSAQGLELREEVISLNRVAKVVKGGRRFSFSALVAVGNEAGIVGVGFGKAREVPQAISKAVENAKHNLTKVWRRRNTVPYQIVGEYGSARVLLKPASEGTGIIAGTAVRTVCELAGIKDVLTKSLGSDNVVNVVKATLQGLRGLRNPRGVAELRGQTLTELVGEKLAEEIANQERDELLEASAPKVAPPAEEQTRRGPGRGRRRGAAEANSDDDSDSGDEDSSES